MPLTKIDTGAIKDDAINSAKIADGTVVASDVLDNTITGAKLASDIAITTSGNITTTGAFTSTGIDDNATSTAITIDSSKNVGIGLTSPSEKLTVLGDIGTENQFIADSLFVANTPGYSFRGDTDTGIFRAGANQIGFSTGASERMRITSSGNVGIGTSSPSSGLEVDNANGVILSRSGYSQYMQLQPANNNVPTILGLGGNGIHIGTTNTTGIHIDGSDNVGIATTSPATILELASSVNNNVITFDPSNSGSNDDILGGLDIQNDGSVGRLTVRRESSTTSGYMKFETRSTGGALTERMRIAGGGNIGIGTSSPSNLLHLTGPQNGTALQIANTVDTNGIRINAGISGLANNSLQFLNQSGDSLLIIDGNNKSTIVGNIGPSGYRASFGDFEVKNQDGAGNPGGTLVLSNTDGSITSGQHLGNLTFASYDSSGATTTGGVASIRAVASETYGSTSGANLRFYTHPSSANNGTVDGNMSERMRIDSSGNVGIGTGTFLTPDSLLEIGIDANNLGNQRLLTVGTTDTAAAGETGIYLGALRTISPSRGALISAYHNYAGSNACGLKFYTTTHSNTDAINLALTLSGTNAIVAGSLSKGSGSFKIDHPLPSKNSTHHLVHSFTESPQADLIYRGKVDLVNGTATVNIDTVSGMTEGTFVLLNRDIQCFTSNETGWTAVKGSVSGNTLTITAQDNTCTDTISWMVIGERQDQHMIDTDWTDENGKVIVEPLKETEE